MSKPMLVTVPFLLLLLDFWPLGRISAFNFQLSAFRDKIPFFVLTFGFSWLTMVTQRETGAMVLGMSLDLGTRVQNAIVSYLRYLGKFFWPSDLAVIYPHPAHSYGWVDRWPEWQVWVGGLALVLISVLALLQLRTPLGKPISGSQAATETAPSGRKWKASLPVLFTGWFWFLGMMVPVIGIVQVGDQAMADRYGYLPLIGIGLVVAWAPLFRRSSGSGGVKANAQKTEGTLTGLVWAAAIAIILMLAWQAHRQVKLWKDTVTLFEHTLRVTADNPAAHLALGTGFEHQDQVSKAIPQYYASLRIEPRLRMAHYNLGQIFRKRGLWRESVLRYEATLREKPNDLSALLNLASVLPRVGRTAQAITRFEEALRQAPNSVEGLNNLSWILSTSPAAELRNGPRAVELGEKACALTGQQQPGMLGTLAAAYAEASRFPEAIATAEKAIALAQGAGNGQLVEINRGLLKKYQEGQPHREEP